MENTITKQTPQELFGKLPAAVVPEVGRRMGVTTTSATQRLLNPGNHMHRDAWQMVRTIIEERIKQGGDFLELLDSIPEIQEHEVGGEG